MADPNSDPNVGSSRSPPVSASQLLSVLAPVFAFAALWLLAFLILRRKFPRYYRPRTFLGREESRTPTFQNDGFLSWMKEFWNRPDTYVLNHHTLDGYLFLRFLKISVICCLVGCCITWPVLFPINATGGGGSQQLDVLTMGNVKNKWKYFAHAGCAIIFFGFLIYMITRESIYYINLRQAYLMSPLYASRISSRTVLYTSVPEEYMTETKIRQMLEPGVVRVWFATDCKELSELVDERDTVAMKLEGAETALIKAANGNRLKAEKKGSEPASEEKAVGENAHSAAQYVDAKKRPTHRLKFLIGKKVDTIEWSRSELERLIPEVNALQKKHIDTADGIKKLNSVFVEFETLSQAQAAFQSLTHHQPLHMAPRFTGMTPTEVIWSNLRIKWWERIIRQIVTLSLVVATVIFWSIPVAVVGIISKLNYITDKLPWLDFIYSLPPQLLGIITGLLPVVMLVVLMALLPIFLRLMAKQGGCPTLSAVELTVQNYYFAFQVVQVFLVTTLTSAAASAVTKIINSPASVTSLLAESLPTASDFYLSYFVLQGLGVFSGTLTGLVGLVIFIVLGKILDKTPRKMYKRWITLSGVGWGTLFPIYTNLFVIAICYAVIAPLVLIFAAVGLFFFYFAFRYNLLFVSNASIDTKGLVYPRALQQLFVGLYIAEVCLIGLFGIATGESRGALGPLILMILMLIFTALYQISLNAALDPLLTYLPKSIDAEERRLLDIESTEHADAKLFGNGQEKKAADLDTVSSAHDEVAPAPHKKPGLFQKWLRPDIYTDYATMRRMVPKDIAIHYSPEHEQYAFLNPAITSQTPLLWIPRDPVGMSQQEVAETSKVIPITDESAYLDEKNNVCWDAQDGRPPIYEEVPYY